MKDPPIRRLEGEALELLTVEKARPGAPAAVKESVKARLAWGAGAANLAGSRGTSTTAVASHGIGRMTSLVIAFMSGGVVGAAVHAKLSQPLGEHASRAPAVMEVVAPPVPASTPAEDVDALEKFSPPAASETRETRAPSQRDLKAERSLLDKARAALGRGDNSECLAIIKMHGEGFARGRLAEEREAPAVKALVNLGRIEEARQRGARFRARYPRSLLLPAVETALETIP